MKRVLHITGWYPNKLAPHEAPFIVRHIDALEPHVRNTVWHVDVRPGARWRCLRSGPHAQRTFLVTTPLHRWMVIEWIATLLILWAWATRKRSEHIDVINFHIAYPNCTRIRLMRWFIHKPMLITEHFSAYNVGFNSTSKGSRRIKRIFHTGVPVIVVSRALQGDIERFIGPPAPTMHVVDNAMSEVVFHPDPSVVPEPGRFFTIAAWRPPKRPDLVLEALAQLRAAGLDARLRIAGGGPGLPAIQERIAALGLEKHVDLLGQLDEQAVADEMRHAHALVHASDYETYSAVCAEALCCGTPVIASRVGGIPEFVSGELGALVPSNTIEAWVQYWKDAWQPLLAADRTRIAATMTQRAGARAVGERYHRVLLALWEAHRTKH